MGARFCALSWYLGVANPTPKQVREAKMAGAEHALELKGGHCRKLAQEGFVAAPPAVPKSLTGTRQRLGSDWANTMVDGLQVRRPVGGELQCRLSQVLFRVSDLQIAFT